jgi:hypothetical protein
MLGDWGDAASRWLEGEAAQPEGEAEMGRGGDAAHGWKGSKRREAVTRGWRGVGGLETLEKVEGGTE